MGWTEKSKTNKEANVFYKLCKSAMAAGRMIAVFTGETTRCSVGFVDSLTPHELRLAALSQCGEESEYEVFRFSSIRRIDWGSSYENAVERLINGFDPGKYSVSLGRASKSKSLISDTLTQAAKSNLVVSLYDKDEDCLALGYVENVDNTSVILRALDDYGADDGSCIILLDSICSLTCNSRGDRALSFLNEKREKHP